MASRGGLIGFFVITAVSIATLWQPLLHRVQVLGFTRSQASIQNSHPDDQLIKILNTVHCEDLHYHHASNMLYTACEGATTPRNHWFPPLGHMSRHDDDGPGKIVVVDPSTFKSTELVLSGFPGPLVTHGIDLFPAEDGQSVTIFAVNHLPNPDYNDAQAGNTTQYKARSHVEVFSHDVGSDTAVWIRSVQNPQIRTPNDIFATSPTSFYVTNDHHYRDGALRFIEDLLEYNTGAWSDVVHVSFTPNSPDATSGITSTIALPKAHNPNGLGHSAHADEVLLTSAAGGELYIMHRDSETNALSLRERIQLDSTIDNPSYYEDVYATPGNNASGYLLAGLTVAHALADVVAKDETPIPVIVWHVRTNAGGEQEKAVLFENDGRALRSASAAVLVGIDPKENSGRKQAWLFVTGFVSQSMVAVKVDL